MPGDRQLLSAELLKEAAGRAAVSVCAYKFSYSTAEVTVSAVVDLPGIAVADRSELSKWRASGLGLLAGKAR